jgi:protein subunit release factor A
VDTQINRMIRNEDSQRALLCTRRYRERAERIRAYDYPHDVVAR